MVCTFIIGWLMVLELSQAQFQQSLGRKIQLPQADICLRLWYRRKGEAQMLGMAMLY
jgi:hypothetical protein